MGGGGSAQLTQSGFKVEYDRSGRARCKQCKVKISRLDLRMGKLVYSFFDKSKRTSYHLFHPRCLFLNLKRCRTTTRVLKSVDDVLGFTQISHQDQELLTILIGVLIKFREQRKPTVCIKKQARTAPNRKHQSTTSVALTKDHIIVLYTNADVLTEEKKRELGVHIAQEKPHIIAVTEVNPKARCFQQQDYQIPNYIMFDVNVGAQGRRGVVVFVHTSLEKSVSSIEIVSEFEETLLLSLKLRAGDCLLFGVFYRSPSSSESNNLALNTILSTLCVQESPKYSHLCVVGDFNFPVIHWSAGHTCQEGSMEDKFIETMENCFLHQHILSPTRCRGNTTPHILDLVLSNEAEMVSEAAITRLSHSSIVAMLTGQSHNINSIMAKGTL